MGKIRYIITGNVFDDDESFSPDDMEELRIEVKALCDSYGIFNLKVTAEDDWCIKVNDRK